MGFIVLPPGRWQVICASSAVFEVDNASDTADKRLDFGEESKPPLVVDLVSGAMRQLKDGDSWHAATDIASAPVATPLPAITVEAARARSAAAPATRARERSMRLAPMVADAMKLLRHAASTKSPTSTTTCATRSLRPTTSSGATRRASRTSRNSSRPTRS